MQSMCFSPLSQLTATITAFMRSAATVAFSQLCPLSVPETFFALGCLQSEPAMCPLLPVLSQASSFWPLCPLPLRSSLAWLEHRADTSTPTHTYPRLGLRLVVGGGRDQTASDRPKARAKKAVVQPREPAVCSCCWQASTLTLLVHLQAAGKPSPCFPFPSVNSFHRTRDQPLQPKLGFLVSHGT